MIPYDDLVIALQTWRAKQGLPVAQMSGQLTPPPAAVVAPKTAPPVAPPRAASPEPLALETHEESLDVDGALIEEAQYENEGADFAMGFAAEAVEGDDATSIGGAPRPADGEEGGTEVASPGARRGGNRGEEW